ncbi:hypothetical protein WMY93_012233 [Mugilogobius chulae]|uniref:Apolipoprotein M n=1 Tax=Mugilogobius chulae TaxID=88201 RepID=A0AAW0P8C3_9GOBI
MKVVYAALCLGLLSVCRAAPLTCDQLVTTKDPTGTELSGIWHLHALSTDSCVLSNILHTFLKPSIMLNVAYEETSKSYEITSKIKTMSYCMNETESFVQDKASLSHKHKKELYHIMQSSCSDCIVLKTDSLFKAIFVYSRKTTFDAADLKEFETQAACLGLPQPQTFGTDYDFGNCKDLEDSEPTDEETSIMIQRLEDLAAELMRCLVRYILSWVKSSQDSSNGSA